MSNYYCGGCYEYSCICPKPPSQWKREPCRTPTHACDEQQAEGSDICIRCGVRCDEHKRPSRYITREEAAEIAKNTGGDPEVWDRLYGLETEPES